MKNLIPSSQAQPVLFKDWGLRYLELEEVKRLRSYRDRQRIVRQQLIPFCGSTLLQEITSGQVEAYRAQRRKEDGGVPSLQTVSNDHISLKHCLNVAVRRGLFITNPACKVPLSEAHNEQDRVLSDSEWNELYDSAASHLMPILLLAYHLGQRFGEIVQLTWDRVDLQRGFIVLRPIDTRTKKPRQVPITPAVRTALADLAKVRRLNTNHVFSTRGSPSRALSEDAIRPKAGGSGRLSFSRFTALRGH
ncbi:MAG: tyrosine-type recombinase/integrase [Nitrospira sp.]